MDLDLGRKRLFSPDLWLLVGALVTFTVAGMINNQYVLPRLELSKQQSAINFDKNLLVFMSAGNKRLVTDSLWIQTLIESDLEHYNQRDLNSWMYLRFKTISYLDPRFYQNYIWGGKYLSIVKDDLRGAVDILQTGLKYFPEDYDLLYNLGFTYYYELEDYHHGAIYLSKIMGHPRAPTFLRNIVGKMKFEMEFDYETGLSLIQENIRTSKDNYLIAKLKKDYYALKAERDLTCLKHKRMNCEQRDANGVPYILRQGKFYSAEFFTPYRLHRRTNQNAAVQVNSI